MYIPTGNYYVNKCFINKTDAQWDGPGEKQSGSSEHFYVLEVYSPVISLSIP